MNKFFSLLIFLFSLLISTCANFFAPFETSLIQQTSRIGLISSQSTIPESLAVMDTIEGQQYEMRVRLLNQLAIRAGSEMHIIEALPYEQRSLILNTAAATIFNLKSCGMAYKYFLEQDTAINMLETLVSNMNKSVSLDLVAVLLSAEDMLYWENLQVIFLAAFGGIISELAVQSDYANEGELVQALVSAFQATNIPDMENFDVNARIDTIFKELGKSLKYAPDNYTKEEIMRPLFFAILFLNTGNRPDLNSFMVAGAPATEWFFKIYYLIHGDIRQ